VLVTSDEEVRNLMLDGKALRSRIKIIVAANIEVGASKREDSKIRLGKTRSAIVAIWYTNLIELRDILSRLVAVVSSFFFTRP
jgi:hypothetical protein